MGDLPSKRQDWANSPAPRPASRPSLSRLSMTKEIKRHQDKAQILVILRTLWLNKTKITTLLYKRPKRTPWLNKTKITTLLYKRPKRTPWLNKTKIKSLQCKRSKRTAKSKKHQ